MTERTRGPLPEATDILFSFPHERYTADQLRAYADQETAALQQERDNYGQQLAECQNGYETLERETAALRAEVEALRKDAERWRYVRSNPEWIGWDADFDSDSVDHEVDAAMAGGEHPP